MEIIKPNDLFVASFNNPQATTYDLMSADLNPNNTSLYTKDEYKNTEFVRNRFRDENGQFDDVAFDNFYNKVASQYKEMTDDTFLKGLDTIKYSPFDITRPKEAETYRVSVEFSKDYNPYKQLYSRTGINSIDDGNLSLRELAQKSKVYDPETDTWSIESANDMNLLNKFFGDTLVYAQYDDDGVHKDLQTGRSVAHKKGDWKINEDGNLFLEKLGNREIYGKQVVNPTDMLTTDGSFANKFDIWDSDSREKSILSTSAKVAFDIAPFLIPGAGTIYGGIKAAIGLSTVMPTFYKSLEGMLLGDTTSSSRDMATAAEGYLAKFNQNSISDAGQDSLFNYEQMSQIVSSIFSQIYEQRAAASLAMIIKKPSMNIWEGKAKEIGKELSAKLGEDLAKGKITDPKMFNEAYEIAKAKIPQLASVVKEQGALAKSLSLGYMAITSTSDIYGQAIEGGYDRRTAGFAALASAAGQYGIMMNNRMGDWFLDKSTGYSLETNKALIRKAVRPLMDEVQIATKEFEQNAVAGKIKLAGVFAKIKNNFEDVFLTPSVVGEAMWKNSIVEGVEEVTEQIVQDTTKGIIDTMSWLGLTKNQGSFGGTDVVFSKAGWENYLSNFVGGILGGAMFEFNRSVLEKHLQPDTRKEVYELIADGHKDELIAAINSQKGKYGNNYISLIKEDGTYDTTPDGLLSQADVISKKSIEMVELLDGILNSQDLKHTDSEIVQKAIRDSVIIKNLNNAKEKIGNKNVGLEGLILSDYKTKMHKILDITQKINELTGDEKTDNKENISLLEEERTIYKNEINGILKGEKAEEYFNEISFYLNKAISDNWIIVDKDTFSRHKYGKSYKDLPNGSFGITKERVDKSYKEYIDSKDVFKELKATTKAYLEFEKLFGPAIAKFIDSGYLNEVSKTFKNLFNNASTRNLFETEEETTLQNIVNYLEISKLTESKPGNTRVLPWDAIYSNLSEKIENSSGYVVSDKDKVITLPDGTTKTSGEIASNILHNLVSMLPPEQIDYNVLSELYKSEIAKFNRTILDNKKEEFGPLESRILEINNILKDENSVLDSETKEKLVEEKADLQNQILKYLVNAELKPYEASPQFLRTFAERSVDIQNKYEGLGLSSEDIGDFIAMGSSIEELELIPEEIPFNELQKVFEIAYSILGKSNPFEDYFKQFTDIINSLPISEEEKIEILTKGYYGGKNLKTKKALKEFNKFLDNTRIYINSEYIKENKKIELYNAYSQEISKIRQDLITNTPELFKVTNIMLERLIEELKTNKNLDGELIHLVKNTVKKYLNPIIKISSELNFTEENILELASDNTLIPKLQSQLNQFITDISNADIQDIVGTQEIIITLAKFLIDSKINNSLVNIGNTLNTLTDDEEDINDAIITSKNIVNDITKTLDAVINNKSTLQKIGEVFNDTLDTKKFISNPLYDLLRQINLSLDSSNKAKNTSVFDIYEAEENKLNSASDLSAYMSNGINIQDLAQAVNAIKLAKTVVLAMSTTELTPGDPYGFIISRQNFVKKLGLKSEVSDLKTITSDQAQLMLEDLERMEIKINFLKELARYNSGLIEREQKIIESSTNSLFINNWKQLLKKDIKFNEKPLIPDLREILDSLESDSTKLFKIENAFYQSVKDYSKEERLEIGKLLAKEFPFINTLETLYNKNGLDEITKDITSISNNDMLMYLLSVMSISSNDFNMKLKAAYNNGFDKAPFFTQEIGVRIMYASLLEPDLFSEIIKELSPIEGKVELNKVQTHDASLITFILGNAGVGKTTVMYKLLTAMLLDNNSTLNIWYSAPGTAQVEKLFKDSTDGLNLERISYKKLTKNQLYEILGIKDLIDEIEKDKNMQNKKGEVVSLNEEDTLIFNNEPKIEFKTDLPDLIFIDESTNYKAFELDLINRVVKKAKENGKIIKVFAAGDQFQEGADYERTNASYNYNIGRVSGIFVPQLSLTIRAQNNQKRDNNEFQLSILRKINRIWEHAQVSNDAVFNTILKAGLSFRFFKDKEKNIFNGDLLSTSVPDDVLLIMKKVVENTDKTIGILSENGIISSDLEAKLERLQIPKAINNKGGYVIVDTKEVQGREFDYFIFNLSSSRRKSIFDTLKSLYTYSSRAKNGTVIVNDTKISFSNKELLLSQIEDFTTEELSPLTDSEIVRLKDDKIEKINSLLGSNPVLMSDFAFSSQKEDIISDIDDVEITTESDEIDSTIYTPEDELDVIKFSISKIKQKNKESVGALIHTFYHDLGVNEKIDKKNNKVTLTLNPAAKYNYIISALFEGKDVNIMDLDKYEIIKNAIITEKFNVLKNKEISDTFIQLMFGTGVVLDEVATSFAVTTDTYDDNFNSPKDLTYNKESKRLHNSILNKSKYLNLVIKLIYEGKEYVLPIGTFPNLDTVKKVYGENHSIFKSISTLMDESVEGTFKILDGSKFDIITSTRLYTDRDNKQKTSLKKLKNIPGIKFYNSANKRIPEPQIEFFPKTLSEYKKLFEETTFGQPISSKKLQESFDKRAGRAYIRVSYIDDPTHIQFITLHSEQRSWEDLYKIIYGKEVKDSLREKVIQAWKKVDNKVDFTKVANVDAIYSSLFSANDILDLWIALAKHENGEIYKAFLTSGKQWLNELFQTTSSESKEGILRLFGDLEINTNRTVLDLITYGHAGAVDIYKKIMEIVEANPNISAADVKKEILPLVRLPQSKWWAKRFWNIFALQDTLERKLQVGRNPITKTMDTNFLNALNDIIAFWKGLKREGLYFNIPLNTKGVNTFDKETLENNLYTFLEPEGPHVLLDLNKIGSIEVNPIRELIVVLDNITDKDILLQIAKKLNISNISEKSFISTLRKKISEVKGISLNKVNNIIKEIDAKEDQKKLNELEKIKKLEELHKIKVNRKPILEGSVSDSLYEINNKLTRAILIKDILDTKKSTFPLKELLDFDNIGLKNILDSISDKKGSLTLVMELLNDLNADEYNIRLFKELEEGLESYPEIAEELYNNLTAKDADLSDLKDILSHGSNNLEILEQLSIDDFITQENFKILREKICK